MIRAVCLPWGTSIRTGLETEKRKSEEGGRRLTFWHLFSSLPTFIPLLFPHTCPAHATPPQHSVACLLKNTANWHIFTPPNFVHQSFVMFLKPPLHGVEPKCHLALCCINKHPHGQTALIRGPVRCVNCVVQFLLPTRQNLVLIVFF